MSNLIFILVHGTWASKSPWTMEDSLLRLKLKSEFGSDIIFDRIEWSGRNNEADRKKGGEELSKKIKLLSENYKDSEIILISHSHGTDVVLKSLMESGDKIKRLIAFNSPFIFRLKRDFVSHIGNFIKYFYFSILTLLTSFLLFCLVIFALTGIKGSHFGEPIVIYRSIIILTVAVFLLGYFHSKISNWVERNFQILFKKVITSEKLKHRHEVKTFALNSSGDEAYTVLQFFSVLTNLPYILMHRILVGFIFLLASACVFIIIINSQNTLGCGSGNLSFFCSDYNDITKEISKVLLWLVDFSGLESGLIDPNKYGAIGYYYLDIFAHLMLAISGGIIIALIYISIMFTAGYLLNLIYVVIALGFTPSLNMMKNMIFVRYGVDALPFNVNSVRFFDSGVTASILNHSEPYSDPNALDEVCNWIKNN